MKKKYILRDETIEINGHTLHEIKAVMSFGDVEEGDLGGWVEHEGNLSHEGDCWVADDACVFDNARVYGDAFVCVDAWVYGDAQVHDNSQVGGEAHIYDAANIYGNAKVFGNAQVYGMSIVRDKAKVFGKTNVHEMSIVCDNAKVFDYAEVRGNVVVGNDTHVCGRNVVDNTGFAIPAIDASDGDTRVSNPKSYLINFDEDDVRNTCNSFKNFINRKIEPTNLTGELLKDLIIDTIENYNSNRLDVYYNKIYSELGDKLKEQLKEMNKKVSDMCENPNKDTKCILGPLRALSNILDVLINADNDDLIEINDGICDI